MTTSLSKNALLLCHRFPNACRGPSNDCLEIMRGRMITVSAWRWGRQNGGAPWAKKCDALCSSDVGRNGATVGELGSWGDAEVQMPRTRMPQAITLQPTPPR